MVTQNVYSPKTRELYKKKLLGDKDKIHFTDAKKAQEIVDFQADHSMLIEMEKKLVMFAGASYYNLEAIAKDECRNAKIKERGEFYNDFGGIDPDDPDNWRCVKQDTGLFLVCPGWDTVQWVLPISYTAFRNILEQAADTGGIMQKRDERFHRLPDGTIYKEYKTEGSRSALPIQKKAERLTEDMWHCFDTCQILLREGMVAGFFSSKYRYIPAKDLKMCLEARLKESFPDFKFIEGEVSLEYLWLKYELNTPEFEGTVKGLLNDAGYRADKVTAGVRFSTSDVGRGSIQTAFYVKVDGVDMPLGCGISMPHLGNASAEEYYDRLKGLAALLKDCDARIEQLANMDIRHPGKVILDIYKHETKHGKKVLSCLKGMLNAIVAKLDDKFPNGATGVDVYMAFNTALNRYRENNNMSPTKYLDLSEYIAGTILYLPLDLIDKGTYYRE